MGQEANKSVLLNTSRAAHRRMTTRRNKNEGCFRGVKFDVRDLGGHLDVTLRALAGTLSGSSHRSGYFNWSPLHGNSTNAWDGVPQTYVWFMDVRVLPSLSAHSVHSEPRLPVRSRQKASNEYSCITELVEWPSGIGPCFLRHLKSFSTAAPDEEDRVFRP